MKKNAILNNAGAERIVLASIIQRGMDGLIDLEDIINTNDFYQPYAQKLFNIFKYLVHEKGAKEFDIATILATAGQLNLYPIIDKNKDEDFLSALLQEHITPDNAKIFAIQIFKLRLARDAWICTNLIQKHVEKIDGTESLDSIISQIEDPIFNFTSKASTETQSTKQIAENFDYTIQQILEQPKDILGIPSGFPKWDIAIGGGLRPESVNLVGARAKQGKSFFCLNVAYNVAKLGIPVLYLDTELTRLYQLMRLTALVSGVETSHIETGKFGGNEVEKKAIEDISESIKKLPITHANIAGSSIKSVLTIARRWLIKNVGLNNDGKAKTCLVIYDYLKLMDTGDFKSNLAEHQLLGFLMTDIHNFAVKWGVPVLSAAQLNRDGVENEGSHVFAGSDRLLWLCTSASILKFKNEDDLKDDPIKNGRQKIIVTDTRFGPGLDMNDYINIKSDFSKAKMVEGPMRSDMLSVINEQIIEELKENFEE